MGSFNPDSIADVISLGVISNSVSPMQSTWTFFGTHATTAAGRGAVGFPKSEINSNSCAPIELTYMIEQSKKCKQKFFKM